MDDYPMLVHQSIGGGTEDELMIYWIDLISARKCYRTPNGYLGNVSRTLHNQILCSITWVLCYWASQLDIQPWPANQPAGSDGNASRSSDAPQQSIQGPHWTRPRLPLSGLW